MNLKETLLISASIGCFLLWILEFRVSQTLMGNYWLLMLCLAFLLGFQYVRYQRKYKAGDLPAVPMKDKKKPESPRPANKKRRK